MHPEALGQSGLGVPISRVQFRKGRPRLAPKRAQPHGLLRPSSSGAGVMGGTSSIGGSGVVAPGRGWEPVLVAVERCRRHGRGRSSLPVPYPVPRSAAPVGGALSAVNGVYIEVLGKGEPELLVLDGSQHR